MADNQGEYCVIFKENGVWTREFFSTKEAAEKHKNKQPPEAKAFLRQYLAALPGTRYHFDTKAQAQARATELGGDVTVLNPMIADLPAELLYS